MEELYKASLAATRAASELAFRLGADSFTASPGYMAGGIGSLIFGKKQSSRAYEEIGRDAGGSYVCIPNMQKEKGRRIAKLLTRLPMVPLRALVTLLGIGEEEEMLPSWFKTGGCFYFKCSYELGAAGMEPCSGQEYATSVMLMEVESRREEGEHHADS